jgi:hypothetical protein
MAGDVPGRSGKGKCGNREKYGMRLVTGLPAMPYPMNNGQQKRFWTTGIARASNKKNLSALV